MRTLLRVLALCVGLVAFVTAIPQSIESRNRTQSAQRAAIEQPFNREVFETYLTTLPTIVTPDGIVLYVVEGDMPLTLEEVREHLVAVGARNKKAEFTPELIVNLQDQLPDYWRAADRRTLSYAVDRESFKELTQYEEVVANMIKAGAEWEAACPECGLRFVHRGEHDGAPSHEKV